MKNSLKFFSFWLLLVLCTATVVFTSCSKDDDPIAVASISLDKPMLSLAIGEDYTLKVTVLPMDATNKTVTWTSSSDAVATVSNGKVIAISPGTATITAKAGNQTANCIVTVSAIAVTGINLDKPTLTLAIGEDYTLTATVQPDNATDKTVTWTSSSDAIATVSNGKVTAISEGTATITAQAGDQTADCVVTVIDPLTIVMINGVKWATCNVAAPGFFAAKPEDAGMFYQWNRRKAWPTTGDITGWDNSYPTGYTWEKSNDPSPAGWRVPTLDEIQKLFDTDNVSNEWTNENGVNGKKFTDKVTKNTLFLPAAGQRISYGQDGRLDYVGDYGFYWSSTTPLSGNHAYALGFDSDNVVTNYYARHYGYSVRSVVD